MSNSIFGNYRLLDLLDLKTTSGNIDITSSPDAADKDGPDQAAEFVASTMSGDIANTVSLAAVPSREYITRVSSSSGTISGAYLMGSTTDFRTSSGRMNLVLSPVAYGTYPPSLVTYSASGSQDIEIRASQNKTALQTLTLRSDSLSGSVTVRCSADFEGTIEARSSAGRTFVYGPGVTVATNFPQRGGMNFAGRYVKATKGSGAGKIFINTASGDVRVIFA